MPGCAGNSSQNDRLLGLSRFVSNKYTNRRVEWVGRGGGGG